MNIIAITPHTRPGLQVLFGLIAAVITLVGYSTVVAGAGQIDPQLAYAVSIGPLSQPLIMGQGLHFSALTALI